MPLSRVLVLWDLKNIPNGRRNRSKNKLAVKRRDPSTCKLLAPDYELLGQREWGFRSLACDPAPLWGTEKGRGRVLRKRASSSSVPRLPFLLPVIRLFLHQVAWSQARFSCARRANYPSATRCMSHYNYSKWVFVTSGGFSFQNRK